MTDEAEEPLYCLHCSQPVVRIPYKRFAGKGEERPYKHKPQRSPEARQLMCHRTTLKEADVTTTTTWDPD